MRIVLVGAGNLATHLGKALLDGGHVVVQVYSRTMTSAMPLATSLAAEATDDLEQVVTDADVYVVAVKDQALEAVIASLCPRCPGGLFVHTAGSMDLHVFAPYSQRYGVLYPMQTFSRNRQVDFHEIPCFVEGADEEVLQKVKMLAETVSDHVYPLSSSARRYLHLSAVFACNFVNHCYDLSARLLEEQHIPFQLMMPLIEETARKVRQLPPAEAQTGPAVRYDENVIMRHLDLLSDHPEWQDLYLRLSQNIHRCHESHELPSI